MYISELIRELHVIKHNHGDIDVTAWHYGGGLDDLLNIYPEYDAEFNVVLLNPYDNQTPIARR